MRISYIASALLAVSLLTPAVTLGATRSVTPPPARGTSSVSSSASSVSSLSLYRSSAPAVLVAPKKVRVQEPLTGTSLFDADENICPTLQKTMPAFPTPVYNMAKGDCALKGKGAQITAYLNALKKIADTCKKQLPAELSKAKQTKKNLDVTVDALPAPEANVSFFAASGSCNDFSAQTGNFDTSIPSGGSSVKYSEWLETITKNTAEYCTMVHEVTKPLVEACASIASEVQCELNSAQANGITDAQKKAFHSQVTQAMKSATFKYNSLDSFYKNTLAISGWGNFKSIYKESNITCGNSSSGKDLYEKEKE